MAKFGDVIIEVVTNENEKRVNEITEKPVEDRAEIADHINHQPVELTINFLITGSDAEERRAKLREMSEADEVFTYTDVKNYTVYENMAINNLSMETNPNLSNGFSGSLSLIQMQMVQQKSAVVSIGKDPATGELVQVAAGDTENRTPSEEEIDEKTANRSMLANMVGSGGDKDEG